MLVSATDHSVASILGITEEPVAEAPEVTLRGRRRNRTVYSRDAILRMEELFKTHQYPNIQQRETLAADLGVAEARIQVWFQNRRARRTKRQETKLDMDGQEVDELDGTNHTAKKADNGAIKRSGPRMRRGRGRPSHQSNMSTRQEAAQDKSLATQFYNSAVPSQYQFVHSAFPYPPYFIHPYMERHQFPAIPAAMSPFMLAPHCPDSPHVPTVLPGTTPSTPEPHGVQQPRATFGCEPRKQQQGSEAMDYACSSDTYHNELQASIVTSADTEQRHIITSRKRPVRMIFPMKRASTGCFISDLSVSEERGTCSSDEDSRRISPNESSMAGKSFSFESLGSSYENDSGFCQDSSDSV